MTNDELEDAKFFNTFAHSGTRWARDPTCWRYMDLLSLLAILQNETIHFTHIMDLYRYDPHEGTGGLLINVVNDPIQPSVMVSPPDIRVSMRRTGRRLKEPKRSCGFRFLSSCQSSERK